jgi:hypothetical protein
MFPSIRRVLSFVLQYAASNPSANPDGSFQFPPVTGDIDLALKLKGLASLAEMKTLPLLKLAKDTIGRVPAINPLCNMSQMFSK